MIVGIILAAGRGKRMNSHTVNKVTLPFSGKPIIVYAVELFEQICDKTILVVGAFADTVKSALHNHQIRYVLQREPLGTADAVRVGLEAFSEETPECVLVGYGDHMMFYKLHTIQDLISLHRQQRASLSMISAKHDNDRLHWGIIVRDQHGNVIDSVEYKDASEEVRATRELNAGMYCFDSAFLQENIRRIEKSPVTGEYYLNAIVKIALQAEKKVSVLQVPMEEIGIGVNTAEELNQSQDYFSSLHTDEQATRD